MSSSHSTTIVLAAVLGASMLGCASDTEKPSGAQQSPQTATVAAATMEPAARVPRDPAIDAYVASMRADLSCGKVHIINSVMNLSNDEAKAFWPIYQDYESELFDLGDQRVELIRRFARAQKDGKLEPRDATELADGYFKFERQRLELTKKYHDLIAARLSPVRAAQFTQIEHRVGTIVDLAIAVEMPLIQAPAGTTSP
jgi:hypothetical protein